MCMGGPGCGGHKSTSSKSMTSSMPKNWGGMKAPKMATSKTLNSATSGFGTPRVRMSFSGKARRGY